jgi:hypothetical protein
VQEELVHPVDLLDEHRENDEQDRLDTQKGGVAAPSGLVDRVPLRVEADPHEGVDQRDEEGRGDEAEAGVEDEGEC